MTLRPYQSLWREGEDVMEERTFVIIGISSHRTWLVRSAAQRIKLACLNVFQSKAVHSISYQSCARD